MQDDPVMKKLEEALAMVNAMSDSDYMALHERAIQKERIFERQMDALIGASSESLFRPIQIKVPPVDQFLDHPAIDSHETVRVQYKDDFFGNEEHPWLTAA